VAPPGTRWRCRSGSTAEKVCNGHMYMCAKFHACFQKCTNIVISGGKPLDYLSVCVCVCICVCVPGKKYILLMQKMDAASIGSIIIFLA